MLFKNENNIYKHFGWLDELKLLTQETMQLLGSSKKDIDRLQMEKLCQD